MREKICLNCGGNEIVLENGQYRCTYCDTVFSYKVADKAVYKYATRISQAEEHLKIKNYDRAYTIAKELSDIHPTDTNPYTIMLLSITSNLTNYHLSEKDRLKAVKIWDKLEQLNAISKSMRNYAEKNTPEKNKCIGIVSYMGQIFCWIWDFYTYTRINILSQLFPAKYHIRYHLFMLLLLEKQNIRKD